MESLICCGCEAIITECSVCGEGRCDCEPCSCDVDWDGADSYYLDDSFPLPMSYDMYGVN
jgi:hypothetical protein